MLSTPFICCSSGVATDCSMVTASAPVYVVETMICGGTISGNCARGKPRSAMRPPRTVMIAITMATMGRLMKKLDISWLLSSWALRQTASRHGGAPDDYTFPRVQSLIDDPHRAHALADLDGSDIDLVLAVHDGDLIAALQLADGALRHEQCPLLAPGHGAYPAILARAQYIAGVWEQS